MKIAVLGTGSMGKLHASIYKDMEDVDSVTICGRDKRKTEELANSLGIQGSTQIPDILRDETMTAIDVCLPTQVHKEFVVSALSNNKHVFCEIPIAYEMNDALEMLTAAKASGRVFQVAQIMRSLAEYEYIAEQVAAGALGKLLSVQLHRYQRHRVSEPIVDLMAFDLDVVDRLVGVPTSVSVRTSSRSNAEEIYAILNYPELSCAVEFKTIMSRDFPLSHGVRVVGSDGMLETSTVFTGPKPAAPQNVTTLYRRGGRKENIAIRGHDLSSPYDPYKYECRYFLDTVVGKVDGQLLAASHAVDTLRIAIAIKNSLTSQEEVTL